MVRPGALLVALPTMDDPRFQRSVAIVLAHDDDGTLGVILSRPESVSGTLNGILSEWLSTSPPPRSVFRGGPVQEDGFICLAEDSSSDSGVATVDFLATGPLDGRRHRIFRGHAGWAPAQLDDEISIGMWFVADSLPDDVFVEDPDNLWSHVLRRQHSAVARLAELPAHPWLN